MSNKEFQQLQRKITKGVIQSVQCAIADHRRYGNPIFIIRNGKLTKISPVRARNKTS